MFVHHSGVNVERVIGEAIGESETNITPITIPLGGRFIGMVSQSETLIFYSL